MSPPTPTLARPTALLCVFGIVLPPPSAWAARPHRSLGAILDLLGPAAQAAGGSALLAGNASASASASTSPAAAAVEVAAGAAGADPAHELHGGPGGLLGSASELALGRADDLAANTCEEGLRCFNEQSKDCTDPDNLARLACLSKKPDICAECKAGVSECREGQQQVFLVDTVCDSCFIQSWQCLGEFYGKCERNVACLLRENTQICDKCQPVVKACKASFVKIFLLDKFSEMCGECGNAEVQLYKSSCLTEGGDHLKQQDCTAAAPCLPHLCDLQSHCAGVFGLGETPVLLSEAKERLESCSQHCG